MNNSSEYFSLLFQTKEQEEASKKRSDVRVCYRRKLPVQKAYKMIGSRMVLEIEEAFSSFYHTICDMTQMNYLEQRETLPMRKGAYCVSAWCKWKAALERLTDVLASHSCGHALGKFYDFLNGWHTRQDAQAYEQAAVLYRELSGLTWNLRLEGDRVSMTEGKEGSSYGEYLEELLEISVGEQFETISGGISGENRDTPLSVWMRGYIAWKAPGLARRLARFGDTCGMPEIYEFITLSQEIDFFLRALELVRGWRKKGFPVSYGISGNSWILENICDLTLACQREKAADVTLNTLELSEKEPGIWIAGWNQGGKTTFLRSIGQSVYLYLMGLPGIGSRLVFPWISGIFTHFSAEETDAVSDGKLVEELKQLRELCNNMKSGALILLNEMFSSTTASDSIELGELLIRKCLSKGAYVCCVTHVPQLAKKIPKLTGYRTGEPSGSFRMERGEARERARGAAIAAEYHLSAEEIRRTIHGRAIGS